MYSLIILLWIICCGGQLLRARDWYLSWSSSKPSSQQAHDVYNAQAKKNSESRQGKCTASIMVGIANYIFYYDKYACSCA